jgi:hypothetical protein
MKSFTSIFSLFCFAILCFATSKLNAQANAMTGAYTTQLDYENAATTGAGSTAVVALQKPTLQVRLSSYAVATNGGVTLKGVLDLSSNAKKVNVAMLTETRVALAQVTTADKLVVSIYDISTNGSFTLKNTWNGPTVKDQKPGIVRLTDTKFATAVALSTGNLRITSYTIAPNGTITKQDDDDNGAIESVDLARMTSKRVVAGVKLTNDQMKLIAFDVDETTHAINRRGDYVLNGAVKKISMVGMDNNSFVAFSTDSNERLDASSFETTASGNFVLKNQLNDIKKPSNGQYFTLRFLDGQSLGSNGRILLSTIRTSDQLSVIPFTVNSAGLISHNTGDYSPNTLYTRTYSTTVIGGKMVAATRQMDNKYHIRSYNWN